MSQTQVQSGFIGNDSITSAQIAIDAVTTSKIADANITPAKLSTGGPTWNTAGTLTATTFSGNVTGNVTGNAGSVTNGVYTTNFTSSFTGRGYQKFPGGFTIQWGTSSVLSQSTEVQTFATPFTGAVFSVQVTPNTSFNNQGDKRDHWSAHSWTLNGFSLSSWLENTSASYSWVAFGV
jgi:hypothetical protein